MSDIYVPTGSFESEKEKILKEAKTQALQGMSKTASAYIKNQDPYPSSYLSLSDYQIPKTMVEVFKWCRYFYKFDSMIGAAVNSLARFPVTDVIMEDMEALPENWDTKTDSPTLELYKNVIAELKVADELVKIGIDYWLYGNCFIFGEFKDFSTDPMVPDVRWERIFRMDPSKMTIDIDPLTQEKTYKWEVPAKIKRIVREKKPKDKWAKIPEVIKKAVKENKAVILNSDHIYHFSREGESGDGSVWGTPLILNVMKQLAYRNLLRQAQEAIAREHIVPFRVYYLQPNDRMDPQANWTNVASTLAKHLEQAAKDPNYKVVSPIPVNALNLGGQGRALMLTPEIEQLQGEILAGMGVPREFIFGGVSYSAASISLRILENQFVNYRLLLIDFLNNFIIKRMAEKRGEWNGNQDNPYLCSAKLADLKMQDDIQQKQLVVNLNGSNKVSDEYMYGMMGMDADKMKLQLEIETFERMDRERRIQGYQLETDFMVQQQQLQYNMQLQSMVGNAGQVMTQPGGNGQAAQAQVAPVEAEPSSSSSSSSSSSKSSSSSSSSSSKSEKKEDKKEDKPKEKKEDKKEEKGSKDKKEDKPKEKKQEKKAFTQEEENNMEFIAGRLTMMKKASREVLLSKLHPRLKYEILDRVDEMEKSATANPNTVSASAGRNKDLSNMMEVDKLKVLNNTMQDTANKTGQDTINRAVKQLPEKLPPRGAGR